MPSEAYAPAAPGARRALAATIVPMRRNSCTVVVLAGPVPGEVLAAVGRSMNVTLYRPEQYRPERAAGDTYVNVRGATAGDQRDADLRLPPRAVRTPNGSRTASGVVAAMLFTNVWLNCPFTRLPWKWSWVIPTPWYAFPSVSVPFSPCG